jgi:hypothetical protein
VLPTINDYKSEIKLKFGELGPIIEWCNINCIGEWGYQIMGVAGEQQGEYEFYFADKADYINFTLYKK